MLLDVLLNLLSSMTKLCNNPLRRFFLGISFLFFLSCNDTSKQIEEKSPSGYKLSSFEYTLLESTPFHQLVSERKCSNNLAYPIDYTLKNEQIVLTSFFDYPNEELNYIDLIRLVEVPLPIIDATNSITGLSNIKKPLDFRKSCTWVIDMDESQIIGIPEFTTYTVKSYNIGAVLSTKFICTIESNDTKEQIIFTGNWRGTVFHTQKIIIINEYGDIVDECEHPISY